LVLASSLWPPPPATATFILSLHDALPICGRGARRRRGVSGDDRARLRRDDDLAEARAGRDRVVVEPGGAARTRRRACRHGRGQRSEEHTSELQSRENLVCRLLLEKKKQNK